MGHRTAPKGARRPIAIRNPNVPPAIWSCWLVTILHTSPRVSRRAWRIFRERCTYPELDALWTCQRRQDPDAAHTLLTLVTPARLFAVLRELSPEHQGPRDLDVVKLEAEILHRAISANVWR